MRSTVERRGILIDCEEIVKTRGSIHTTPHFLLTGERLFHKDEGDISQVKETLESLKIVVERR